MRPFLLRLMLFLLVFGAALEIVLRWVVPACQSPFAGQNYEYAFLDWDREMDPSGLWTSGRWAQVRAHWAVNNVGWLSEEDYLPPEQRDDKPLIAYFGSSFLQSIYTPMTEHVADHMMTALHDSVDVYGFGFTDAVTSEHLAVSRWVRDEFEADILIFFVGHGYLPHSFWKDPYRTRLRFDDNGQVEETSVRRFVRWGIKDIKQRVKRIPLLAYIFLNARVPLSFAPGNAGAIVQNAATRHEGGPDPERMLQTEAGMDYICRALREAHGDTPILFVMGDVYRVGDPPPEPDAELSLAMDVAERHGIPMLYLDPLMYEVYQRDGRRFDFPHDPHWNSYTNGVVGKIVADHLRERGWLDASEPAPAD